MRRCCGGGTEASVPPRADGSRSFCGFCDRGSAQATAAQVTYDRTVARRSIALTRKVTVAGILCGIDVASRTLEASIRPGGAQAVFPNHPEGIAQLAAFCQQHPVDLAAMEATGGYEQQAFALLSQQGIPVAILNPRSVRQFANSMGLLEKTDSIDAALIAHFAEVKHPKPTPPPA